MARRLYLGKLPPDVRSEDVSKVFEQYGKLVECRVMTGFGFIEYEHSKEAEDALDGSRDKPFMGSNIVVEFAKESRPRRDPYDDRSRGPRSRRPPGIRLIISNVSRDVSWQDLKDFGREAGSVSFADIDRENPGQGILEYLSREDADHAVKELDGRDLRGKPVGVSIDSDRSGPDNYRRDDRRDDYRPRDNYREDRYRDDYRREDRYSRDDRYNRDDRYEPRRDDRDRDRHREDRYSRRDRSKSPRRDDDRKRSPRRDADERRSSNGDEKKREDKDDRYAAEPTASGPDGVADAEMQVI